MVQVIGEWAYLLSKYTSISSCYLVPTNVKVQNIY